MGIATTEKRKIVSKGKHAGEYVHTSCKSGDIQPMKRLVFSGNHEVDIGKNDSESDPEKAEEEGEGGDGGDEEDEADEGGDGGMGGGN